MFRIVLPHTALAVVVLRKNASDGEHGMQTEVAAYHGVLKAGAEKDGWGVDCAT